ncbi:hypothetical protein [Pseudosporangium ferrugineum]|uniref:Uncharacterized protein n=1 Tax=Pseudosporangium ferrugineum TaxID=439699 RepID=A0A2T0RLI6_9ACTN|nr:hypothetical protein [Pseudosporangium ferrugineum]PRY21980.1 hypothetical protein CLV70_11845 [Pseudosporangium ferrugineum]
MPSTVPANVTEREHRLSYQQELARATDRAIRVAGGRRIIVDDSWEVEISARSWSSMLAIIKKIALTHLGYADMRSIENVAARYLD